MSISRRTVVKNVLTAASNPHRRPNQMTSQLAKWISAGGKIR